MEMLEKRPRAPGRSSRRLRLVAVCLIVVAGGGALVSRLDDRAPEGAGPGAEATSDATPPGDEFDLPADRGHEPVPASPVGWQPYIVRLLDHAKREVDWTGSVLSATDGRLTLYLKHGPSQRLRERAAAAPSGLRVVFRQARYSLDELEAARAALMGRDPRVASVVIPASGTALLVGLAPAAFPTGLGPTDRGEITRALGSEVPLILFVDDEPTSVS